MNVNSENVDSPGGQCLLSAVGHTVRLGDDLSLARRNNVLPIRIDSNAEHTRVVVSIGKKIKAQIENTTNTDKKKQMLNFHRPYFGS